MCTPIIILQDLRKSLYRVHVVPCVIYSCCYPFKSSIATWCQKCFTHDSEEKWHFFRFFHLRSLISHSPSSGKRWHRQFKIFGQASDLASKNKETQVNMLIYSMEEAEGILYSFGLSSNDRKKYNTVSNKFEAHFVMQRNPIYEWRSLKCVDRKKENL